MPPSIMQSPPPLFQRSWLRHCRSIATDLLFPPLCSFCGEGIEQSDGGPVLCAACVTRLQPQQRCFCQRCAMPCPEIPAADGSCPHCRGAKFSFSAVRTLGLYEGDLRHAVLRSKHYQHETLAMALGQKLGEALTANPFPTPVDLIAPVPMHWLKRFWRGTNAPETLAASLAATRRLPLATDLLRCRRLLKRQSLLLPGERFQNVRGAYRVVWSFDIRGATILLVDDVITTGASADAIGKSLRRAGAAEVYVIAVARGMGSP